MDAIVTEDEEVASGTTVLFTFVVILAAVTAAEASGITRVGSNYPSLLARVVASGDDIIENG